MRQPIPKPPHQHKAPKPLQRKKRLNSAGKVAEEWKQTKERWFKLNPPDHAGYYICIICDRPVHVWGVTLDHIVPRGAVPKYRAKLSNLGPAHHACNVLKGSMPLAKARMLVANGALQT